MRPFFYKPLFIGILFAFLVGLSGDKASAVEIQRIKSKGGIEAWLVEDHINPIISVKISFRGGGALDPKGKEGLAAMAAGLLDEGAGPIDSQAFRQELEDNGITLRFDAGRDSFSGTLKTLSENRDRAFHLLSLALTQPWFDEEPVKRVREQILANLRHEKEDPQSIVSDTLLKTVFAGHAYARNPDGTKEGVSAITIDDLKIFAGTRLAKDNLVIGVVGDIKAEALARLLDKTFGALPATALPWALPEVKVQVGHSAEVVVEKEIPQSVFVMASEGVKRKDPDYYAAVLVNHVLGGGGFSSRLYEEVRERRGLAYSVYSAISPLAHGALVLAGGGTTNASVPETLKIIRAEWKRMGKDGVSASELRQAKTYVTGAFPLRFVSSGAVAGILVGMQVHELGIDYLEKRNDYIASVTLDDARRVARRLFGGGAPQTVIVGQPGPPS